MTDLDTSIFAEATSHWPNGDALTIEDLERIALDHGLADFDKLQSWRGDFHNKARYWSQLWNLTLQARYDMWGRKELTMWSGEGRPPWTEPGYTHEKWEAESERIYREVAEEDRAEAEQEMRRRHGFSAPIPARVRAEPPRNPRAPRPVRLDPRAEGDIRHLDTDDEGRVRDVLRELERGKVEVERKERPPLDDCFSVDAGHSVRILMYLHIDGSWHVFYVGYHDYDEAERRLERAAKLAMPTSWRPMTDRHFWLGYDAVITSEGGGGGRRAYEVYVHGKQIASRPTLGEAREVVEDKHGPVIWNMKRMDPVTTQHYYFGPTDEFTSPQVIWVGEIGEP